MSRSRRHSSRARQSSAGSTLAAVVVMTCVLVALIGAGTDMLLPKDSSTATTTDNAADAARRSFAQTFGQISQQTVSKNLNVQPTLEIRPGYRFNVLVDQDIVFPKAYQ